MTQILKVNPINPEPDSIFKAAQIIRAGGLVAFPTETVYGLGANGLDDVAVQKIFTAKKRPASDPLILHLENAEQFTKIAVLDGVETLVSRLSKKFMPGALTLVLPKQKIVPLEVTAGGNSVAARVPAHAVAQALIAASGVPIAAPSANLFSRPSPTTSDMVLEDLARRIDAVLDGGEARIGVESTVLSLLGVPTLLRPGGVSLEDIEALIGEVLLPNEAIFDERATQPAPGMLLKHYSPKAKLLLLENPNSLLETAKTYQHEKLGLLLPSHSLERLTDIKATPFDLGTDFSSIAAKLFAGMRSLDRAGCTHILAHQFENTGLGRALNDRLFRAAEGQIISI
jgi:L-threonylcarbamoyladenylate synthase